MTGETMRSFVPKMIGIFISMCIFTIVSIAGEELVPPKAEKNPQELTIHNDTRIDNYYWLNERENPKVIAYLEAENAYTEKMMKHTEALQEDLFKEIVARLPQKDDSAPYRKNGYFYYHRYEQGKEHPIYARKKGSRDAAEEILLNVNDLAKGYDYYMIRGGNPSPDNQTLAFGVDTLSRRKYTVHFKDLNTGEILPDKLPNTTASTAWANDNKTIFYVIKDHTLRPYKTMRHVLGTDVSEDVEVYHESDNTFGCYTYRSKSGRFIMIWSYSTLSSEYRFLDTGNPRGEFAIFQPRERGLEHEVYDAGDKFYIRTNLDAKNFRLMEVSGKQTAKEHWKETVAHREDVLLEGVDAFKDHLVLSERKNGLNQIRIIDFKNDNEHYLEFEEPAYKADTYQNYEFNTGQLRFEYTSLTTPNTVYEYDMNTRQRVLLKQDLVEGDFDPGNYHTERLYAPADDGRQIPISLVYRKGTSLDGNAPLLQYGYGSYGSSMDASFRAYRLSLIDRGFIFAIAHIRGGEEMGRYWYEEGKLLNKKNTFTDFINCSEFLIAEKYTNPEKLFIRGGSAGGLLIGAVINMRPELFRGAIAGVPFVDVVTTMLDESIPLTTGEFDEWGNPTDKEYYDYMLSYSPYDQVKAQEYPNLLVTTGLHDSQVQYWEPAKWVAKLRELKTGENRLLLHTQMEAGHSGKSGRFERYRETALEYAFFLDLLKDMGKKAPPSGEL